MTSFRGHQIQPCQKQDLGMSITTAKEISLFPLSRFYFSVCHLQSKESKLIDHGRDI